MKSALWFCLVAAVWVWLQWERQELGLAWEDSYHHWLVAAHLLQTGRYIDPLTGTSNGWLPLYHWLAAGWLGVFGWHNLMALQWLGALLTLGSAGVLFRGWGLAAAALFLANPVTVLGGGLVATEPLALLWVLLGLYAWQKGHPAPGAVFWGLAALSDRGSWPLVVLAVLWYIWSTRPGKLREWVWTLLPLACLGTGLVLTLAEAGRTAAWAAVDQRQMPGLWDRLRPLIEYSLKPLALPLALACLGLAASRTRAAMGLAILGGGYLAVVALLVSRGDLTGSHRYYLVLVAVLAALASLVPPGWKRFWPAPVALLLTFSFQYLELWPRWVVLNRPSELAGQWITRWSRTTAATGTLVTDSPVVAYYSGWSPKWIRGGYTSLPADTRLVAAITDPRYADLYPLLRQYPQLVRGATPDGWRQLFVSHHWSERYGAKPIRVFSR